MFDSIKTFLCRFGHDVPVRVEVIGRTDVGEHAPEYVPELGDVEVTADVPALRDDGSPLGGFLFVAGDLLTLSADEQEIIQAEGVARWQRQSRPEYEEVPQ